MAQVQKKFIAPNAVDGSKIRLSNNETLRARNAADSADIDILKVDSSNKIQFSSIPQAAGTPSSGNDITNKTYVDGAISAATPTAAAVSYDHTTSGLSATTVQGAIDELDGRLDTAETNISGNTSNISSVTARVGHLETLSGRPSGSDDLGTFTGSTIGDNETIKVALQDLETAVELRALDSVVLKKDGSVALTGDQSAGGHKITNLADPVGSQDAVTLAYMNARLNGLKPKQSVLVATTANITLSGEQTIDGVLTSSSRVLVKNQSTASQNGIYVSASGSWTRATDFDSVSPIDEVNGAWVAVQQGTVSAGIIYVQYGTVTTIGTDAINFEYFNPIAGLVGGDMITLTGSTFSVDLASSSGLVSTNPGNVAGQLKVKVEASNPTLQIDGSNQLGVKLDTSGAIVSGSGGVKVQVDGSTSKINASNQVEVLKEIEQKITLVSGDITNQYVDLAHAAYGADATNNSISVSVVGGPSQEKGVDYTVSLTGGAGGVTRITFAGDLATGGNAALVATDKLVVRYAYLT